MKFIIENYLNNQWEEAKLITLKDKERLSIKLKRLFLLTDGEVVYPKKVVELAKNNTEKIKIHTFGIGKECSKDFLMEIAREGRGSAYFVNE